MSATVFAIIMIATTILLIKGINAKKHKGIYFLLVGLVIFILIATSPGGFKSGSSRSMNHYCVQCGKATSMEIDGRYYCFKHYNARLFGTQRFHILPVIHKFVPTHADVPPAIPVSHHALVWKHYARAYFSPIFQ